VKPARKPDRHITQDVRHQRRRRDDRDLRESTLVPVSCRGCAIDLAEVPIGSEVMCPSCGSWVKALGAPLPRVA